MRISLVYACLGLISVSALAGCGVVSTWRSDCACETCRRPAPRMVVRKNMQTRTVVCETATISGSSQPIGAAKEQVVEIIGAPKQLPAEPDALPAVPAVPMPAKKGAAPRDAAPKDVGDPAPFKIEALPPAFEEQLEVKPRKIILPSQGEKPIELPRMNIDEVVDPAAPPRFDTVDPRAKDKTVALKSVHIQYGHTDGFKSVTGQVQMWRKTVRLRYAPVDQEDQYGGFVVLEGGADLTRLRDGQHIRIRGVLIQPEDRNGAAHYRVQAVEILD